MMMGTGTGTIRRGAQGTAHRLLRLVPVLLLLALLPAALAQDVLAAETTGTIRGTMGGDAFEWRTVAFEVPDGEHNTASYTVFMDTLYSYTLQGHQGAGYVEGAVAITFSSFGGPLSGCPCEVQGDVTFWTTTSMFNEIYLAEDIVITIHEAEELADGAHRLVGSVSGVLQFYEGIMLGPVEGDTVEFELVFEVDRVSQE